MAVASPSFPRFLHLPKELRDAIWRFCLPHRVIEVDFPDVQWYCNERYQYGVDDDDALLRPDGTRYKCRLHHATRINSTPPIISRVCHESRSIALESAQLHTFIDRPTRGAFVSAAWVDHARDTLFLHYHPWIENLPLSSMPVLDYFLAIKEKSGVETVAICDDLLDATDVIQEGAGAGAGATSVLQRCTSYLVCTAVVVIHANESDAIQSGIFGALGEERVVLVDAFDAERLVRFEDFARARGIGQDVASKAFFEASVNGTPKVHYAETPREFMQDLEIRWLLRVEFSEERMSPNLSHLRRGIWLTEPSTFDGRDDDPRLTDYGDLPGRPFARQIWQPNRDHPWVQETLLQMPRFHPVVMFRLCTSDCWSSPALAPPES